MKSGHMIANSFLVLLVLIWWCLMELSVNEDVENMALQKEPKSDPALDQGLDKGFPQMMV